MVSSPQAAVPVDPVDDVLLEFLSSCWSRRTRGNYAFILRGWFTWCATHRHDPMRDIGLSSATSMGPLVGGFRHQDGTTLSPVMGPGGVAGFPVA
jgi:hypothetical protein